MSDTGTAEARRSAYVTLLLTTFVGNISGTLISAPINEIAGALQVGPSAAVLTLSVFMIAMMLGSPAAGWVTDRIGVRRALACSMAIMATAQLAASWSSSLLFLVAMRAVQGAACAVLPPAVQQSLVRHWPERTGRSMAAWASAAAVGQAAGLPLGGFIADAIGWRGVFWTQAVLCGLVAGAITLWVPSTSTRRSPSHLAGTLGLVGSIGLPVVGLTWAAQRGPWQGWVGLVVAGGVAISVQLRLLRRPPTGGGVARRRADSDFVTGTVGATASMFTIGTVLSGITLHLGQELERTPSEIGIIAVCLSLAMSIGSPLSARAAARRSPSRVIALSLGAVAATQALLALLGLVSLSPMALAATVTLLVVTGGAVGALQANAAHQVMSSTVAAEGSAHGLHNMLRFAGIACGYAWVAFAYPVGQATLTFGGAAVVAGCAALLVAVRVRMPCTGRSRSPLGRPSDNCASSHISG